MTNAATSAALSETVSLGVENQEFTTTDQRKRNYDRNISEKLARMVLLHQQAREHGIALPNTARELKDVMIWANEHVAT